MNFTEKYPITIDPSSGPPGTSWQREQILRLSSHKVHNGSTDSRGLTGCQNCQVVRHASGQNNELYIYIYICKQIYIYICIYTGWFVGILMMAKHNPYLSGVVFSSHKPNQLREFWSRSSLTSDLRLVGWWKQFQQTLRIQVCPKKGINPTILLWGWDWGPSNLLYGGILILREHIIPSGDFWWWWFTTKQNTLNIRDP